jgi:hypothetical protein
VGGAQAVITDDDGCDVKGLRQKKIGFNNKKIRKQNKVKK